MEGLISASGVDKRSYSSKHLPNWVAKVTQWALDDTLDYQLPKELERFGQQVLHEKTKKGEAPQHALFDAVDRFLAEPLTLRDVRSARRSSAKSVSAHYWALMTC